MDLMVRMGHDNVRAALIYQHAVRGADKTITDAIDRHISGADELERLTGSVRELADERLYATVASQVRRTDSGLPCPRHPGAPYIPYANIRRWA
jgi:hypothetical protein